MSGNPYIIIGISGSLALCLSETDDFKGTGDFYHYGLNIENFDEVIELLDKHDVPYQYGGPVQYDSSRSVYINDPSGHEIELSEVVVGGL